MPDDSNKKTFVDVKITNKQIYDKIIGIDEKITGIEKKLSALKWHDKILYLGQAVAFAAIGILFGKI